MPYNVLWLCLVAKNTKLSSNLKTMKTNTKTTKNTADCGNKSKPLLGIVYLSEIVPYNETDFACNGGFYNCPECGEQQYTSSVEIGDTKECECGCKYVIK